jgi:hypothetical protein
MHCRQGGDRRLDGPECTKLEGPDIVDQAILAALDEHPFASVRDFAKKKCILSTIVWQRLYSLSHEASSLSPSHIEGCITGSRSADYENLECFITFGKSCFSLPTDYDII